MSKRARPSVSAFDDPRGLDPSFRVGRSFGDIFGQIREGYLAEHPEEKKAVSDYYRASKRTAMPQRRGAKRRKSTRARSHSVKKRRVSSRSAPKRRRTKSAPQRRVRTKSGRRVLRRTIKKAHHRFRDKIMAATVMQPMAFTEEGTFILANIGDNLQDMCSWLALNPLVPAVLDAVLAMAKGSADATTVQAQYQAYMEYRKFRFQIKNDGAHRVQYTIYRLTPRRELPAAFSDMSGINPQRLQDAFSNRASISNTGTRMPAYNEHGANPFRTLLPHTYKIKTVSNGFLEPGKFKTFRWLKRNLLINKAKYGVMTTLGTIASAWDWVKDCGPIYLIRAQGPLVHDNAQITSGKASAYNAAGATANQVVDNVGNYDIAGTTYGPKLTPGGYALSIYYDVDTKVQAPANGTYTNAPNYGCLSARLPNNITRASEFDAEVVVPAQAPMQM